MKKRILFALLLCLSLCVLAFASCQKKDAVGTTAGEQTIAETPAAATAPAATTAGEQTTVPATTTAEPTTQGHVHTPESQMTVLLPPTCSATGIQAYICIDCGATIDETIEEIPIDPDAHKVEKWIVTEEANLLHQTGSRNGVCTVCHENVVETTVFTPTVYDHADPSGNVFPLSAYLTTDVLAGDHFYPTDLNPAGKDFVFEMAILWNETMLNCATDECEICLNYQGGGNDPLYTFVPVNNGSGWCKFAGGFDFSSRTKTVQFGPASGDSKPKENYVHIGEYGWHKYAIRLHEEAEIVSGAVKYTMISYLYIDGVLTWQLELKTGSSDALVRDKNLLFYAGIDENDPTKLVYSDPDDGVSFRFRSDGIADSLDPMCFVYADVVWKAVPADWTPDIEPVSDPTPAEYKLSDTLTVPAAIYFREKTD